MKQLVLFVWILKDGIVGCKEKLLVILLSQSFRPAQSERCTDIRFFEKGARKERDGLVRE